MKILKSAAGLIALATATVLSFPGSAQASCWSNPAICQAICNRDCCNNSLASPQSRERAAEAIERFTVADLQAELAGVPETSPLRTVLTEAIARRRTTPEPVPSEENIRPRIPENSGQYQRR